MEFNQLVFSILGKILSERQFIVIAQNENYVKLKSEDLVITLSHDSRDKSSSFEAGRSEDAMYPITTRVMKDVFDSDIQVSETTKELFVRNIALFFETGGQAFLNGDVSAMNAVEDCIQKAGSEYTSKIIQSQILNQADNAWANGDYREFISQINELDVNSLPPSYILKSKIAQRKLEN